MMKLPTTLLSLILTVAHHAQAETNPIYLTNYTSYPNISLSFTPKLFHTIPGFNGNLSFSAQDLTFPSQNHTTEYPFSIAVRDSENQKKPHFSTTQTLIYLNSSTEDGLRNETLMRAWDNCFLFFKNVSVSANEAGQKDDGTCVETLGSECKSDLERAIDQRNGTGCEDLFVESLPGSCEGKIGLEWVVANMTWNNESYYPLLEVQTPMHRWDNATYLQVAAEQVWPFLWWQSLNEVGVDVFNGSSGSSMRSMGCLRATTRYNATTSDANTLARMGDGQQWMMVAVLAAWTAWNLS